MVKFNKKGLMVKFLTTVILALVIFVPACMMVSKLFFRLSDQAKDNYLDLTKKLQTFAGGNGEPKSFLLITDGETGIFLFAEKERLLIKTDESGYSQGGQYSERTVRRRYFNPPTECSEVPCLCLCREFNTDTPEKPAADSSNVNPKYEQEWKCNSLQCSQLDGKFLPWSYYRNESGERRVVLKFLKENEMVKIANG